MLDVSAPPVDLTVGSGSGAGLSDDVMLNNLVPPVDNASTSVGSGFIK